MQDQNLQSPINTTKIFEQNSRTNITKHRMHHSKAQDVRCFEHFRYRICTFESPDGQTSVNRYRMDINQNTVFHGGNVARVFLRAKFVCAFFIRKLSLIWKCSFSFYFSMICKVQSFTMRAFVKWKCLYWIVFYVWKY